MEGQYYNIQYTIEGKRQKFLPRNFESFDEAKEYIDRMYNVKNAVIREYTHGYNTHNWYLQENGKWL